MISYLCIIGGKGDWGKLCATFSNPNEVERWSMIARFSWFENVAHNLPQSLLRECFRNLISVIIHVPCYLRQSKWEILDLKLGA